VVCWTELLRLALLPAAPVAGGAASVSAFFLLLLGEVEVEAAAAAAARASASARALASASAAATSASNTGPSDAGACRFARERAFVAFLGVARVGGCGGSAVGAGADLAVGAGWGVSGDPRGGSSWVGVGVEGAGSGSCGTREAAAWHSITTGVGTAPALAAATAAVVGAMGSAEAGVGGVTDEGSVLFLCFLDFLLLFALVAGAEVPGAGAGAGAAATVVSGKAA